MFSLKKSSFGEATNGKESIAREKSRRRRRDEDGREVVVLGSILRFMVVCFGKIKMMAQYINTKRVPRVGERIEVVGSRRSFITSDPF